jgi:hypothetical protein
MLATAKSPAKTRSGPVPPPHTRAGAAAAGHFVREPGSAARPTLTPRESPHTYHRSRDRQQLIVAATMTGTIMAAPWSRRSEPTVRPSWVSGAAVTTRTRLGTEGQEEPCQSKHRAPDEDQSNETRRRRTVRLNRLATPSSLRHTCSTVWLRRAYRWACVLTVRTVRPAKPAAPVLAPWTQPSTAGIGGSSPFSS